MDDVIQNGRTGKKPGWMFDLRMCRKSVTKPGWRLIAVNTLACALVVLPMPSQAEVPWSDGETMAFEWTGGSKREVLGYVSLSVESSQYQGLPTWRFVSHLLADTPVMSTVEVDAESLLPLFSLYRKPGTGEVEARFSEGEVTVSQRMEQDGGRSRHQEQAYEIYQSTYLMRRFPHELGYQQTIYTVDTRRPGRLLPAVFRVTAHETIATIHGSQRCFRVTARIAGERLQIWIGMESPHWIYFIEEDSGNRLRLIETRITSTEQDSRFLSGSRDWEMQLPGGWMAFTREDRLAGRLREQITFLIPGAVGTFSMSRLPAWGEFDALWQGSINWLQQNRRKFSLLEGSGFDQLIEGRRIRSIVGRHESGNASVGIFQALVEVDDHRFLITGTAEEPEFESLMSVFSGIIESIRKHEP
jgi:hypothetical protein